jgi:hypothetical protein
MSNLDFYFTDPEASGEIKNIVFRDCNFECSGQLTFTDCQFLGVNHFTAGIFTVNNCTGNPIYSEVDITIAGDNKLSYQTPNKIVAPKASLKQFVFSEAIEEGEADYDSIFLNKQNSRILSFKRGDGIIFTINLT